MAEHMNQWNTLETDKKECINIEAEFRHNEAKVGFKSMLHFRILMLIARSLLRSERRTVNVMQKEISSGT